MDKIHLRKDIVMQKVSDIYILVALRSAWGICPFATTMAPSFALIWTLSRDGQSVEEIIRQLMEARDFSEEKARKILKSFIKAADKCHYLLASEDAFSDNIKTVDYSTCEESEQ